MKIDIVPLSYEHIDGIMDIEEESFAVPWSKKSLEGELNNKLAIYIVALCGDEVVGYGGMWHVVTEGHITNIAVKKNFRRQGIGDHIVKELIKTANEKEMIGLTLEVRKSNEAALKLYKNNGFRLEGIRKEYYENNKEDAFIMWKILNPEIHSVDEVL